MPHGYDFVKLGLTVLQNIDLFGYLLPVLVLVFRLEIHVSVGVYIIEDGANFGETRQHLGHEDLRLPNLHFLDIIGSVLFHLLEHELFVFVFHPNLPGF